MSNSKQSYLKIWFNDNACLLGILAVILVVIGLSGLAIYLADRSLKKQTAEIEAPYIASKDIAITDIIRNKGGGIKHWSYHYNVFASGTGCFGMTIQVDVAHQSPVGKYTESIYCCDGKECRPFSSKEF
jgi:hypothetical protein